MLRTVAFTVFSANLHEILEHIGAESKAARIAPARGPPLWDVCGAQEMGTEVDAEPDWELANPSPPGCPDDQRTT